MAVYDIANVDVSLISQNEIFILDANILSYLYAGYPLNKRDYVKVSKYSNFISDLLSNGNDISTSAAYVQEVLNYIEKTEYSQYKRNHPNDGLTKKQFRNDSALRSYVAAKTDNVYKAICQNCHNVYDVSIKKQITDGFVNGFCKHVYDPIDYIVADDLAANNRVNIITDDKDYRLDKRLRLYTFV